MVLEATAPGDCFVLEQYEGMAIKIYDADVAVLVIGLHDGHIHSRDHGPVSWASLVLRFRQLVGPLLNRHHPAHIDTESNMVICIYSSALAALIAAHEARAAIDVFNDSIEAPHFRIPLRGAGISSGTVMQTEYSPTMFGKGYDNALQLALLAANQGIVCSNEVVKHIKESSRGLKVIEWQTVTDSTLDDGLYLICTGGAPHDEIDAKMLAPDNDLQFLGGRDELGLLCQRFRLKGDKLEGFDDAVEGMNVIDSDSDSSNSPTDHNLRTLGQIVRPEVVMTFKLRTEDVTLAYGAKQCMVNRVELLAQLHEVLSENGAESVCNMPHALLHLA
jgi:class 3 adenylate cyclase